MRRPSPCLAMVFLLGCTEQPVACDAFLQAPIGDDGCHISVGECERVDVATVVCLEQQCDCYTMAYDEIDLGLDEPDASFSQRATCALSSDDPADHRAIEELFESDCGYRLVNGGSS